MMYRRHVMIALMFFCIVCSFLYSITPIKAWSDSEITSNAGEAPEIDGEMDDEWLKKNVNQSYHDFSGNRRITLYVQHVGSSLYFLIEVKFQTTQEKETISIYISTSSDTDEDDFLDKKQITMENATQKGNETYKVTDLHRNRAGSYIKDVTIDALDGAAAIGKNNYRFYEYKIDMTPSNESENSYLLVSRKYAFKLGINNSASNEEISEVIKIQIGPKNIPKDDKKKDYTEFDFDKVLYMKIIVGISLGILILYGIAIIVLNPKAAEQALEEQRSRRLKSSRVIEEEAEEDIEEDSVDDDAEEDVDADTDENENEEAEKED